MDARGVQPATSTSAGRDGDNAARLSEHQRQFQTELAAAKTKQPEHQDVVSDPMRGPVAQDLATKFHKDQPLPPPLIIENQSLIEHMDYIQGRLPDQVEKSNEADTSDPGGEDGRDNRFRHPAEDEFAEPVAQRRSGRLGFPGAHGDLHTLEPAEKRPNNTLNALLKIIRMIINYFK